MRAQPLQAQTLRTRWPDLISVLAGLAALIALVTWFHIDARPSTDMGHYYSGLPRLYGAVGGQISRGALVEALGQQGGLYNLLLAASFHLFGRAQATLEAVEVAWMGLLVVSTHGTARALGGRWAALIATCLLVAMPLHQVGARTHWLHFVEAAMAMPAAWALAADPRLERRHTPWVYAACVAFCFSLRTTGLVLLGPLLVLAAVGAGPARRGGIWPALLAAVPGLIVLVPKAETYLAGKVGIRETYAALVRPLLPSLAEQTFLVPGLIGVAGLLLALGAAARAGVARSVPEPAWALLLVWLVTGIGVAGLFNAGIDNFPLTFVALAVFAGLGFAPLLENRPAYVNVAASLGLLSLGVASLAAPFLPPPVAVRLVPALGPSILSFDPWQYQRPQSRAVGPEQIRTHLETVCQNQTDGTCSVLASTGIFSLNREDDGQLALFLAGLDDVRIFNAPLWWNADDLTAEDALEGLVVMDCPNVGAEDNHFGERARAVEALAREVSSTKVGGVGPPAPCPQTWYRLETEDPRSALQRFAGAYPWKHHTLPEASSLAGSGTAPKGSDPEDGTEMKAPE